MHKPHFTLGITCVGGNFIADIVNALRAAPDFSVTIIGVDANPEARGRVLCDHFTVLPMAEKEEHAYVEGWQQLRARHRVELVLILSEGESRVLAGNAATLQADGLRLSVGSQESVETMTDKLRMLEVAASKGIDNGPFYAIDGENDVGSALRELGYPKRKVIIKPRKSYGTRGVMIVDGDKTEWNLLSPERFVGIGDQESVSEAVVEANIDLTNMIAVPFVDGPIYDVDCLATEGQMHDVVGRLRQWGNPLSASSTGNKIDMNPRVIDHAKALCEAFTVDGCGDFDMVIEKDGRPTVFDASARLSGSVGGSVLAGVNIPAQLVRQRMKLPLLKYHVTDGCIVRPFATFLRIPDANQNDFI